MPNFVTVDYNKAQLKEMDAGEFLTVPTGSIFTIRTSAFNNSPDARGILIENRDQITVFFYVTGTMPVGTAIELEFFAKAYPRTLGSIIKTMTVGATDELVQFDITDDLLGEADYVKIAYKFKQGTAYTVSQLFTNIKKFDSDETLGSLTDIETNTGESAASLAVIEANLSSIGVFIQDCNTAADFAAVSDAQNLANDTEHVTGTASTEWDKTGGSNVISGVDDTLAAAVDLSVFSSGDYITACFFLPSLTDVVKVHIQVGTDNSNFTEWEWLVADLTTGWNLLYATLADYASLTGTGMQQGVVTYVQAAVEFGLAADTLNDMKVDHIAFVTSESLSDPSSAAILAVLNSIDTSTTASAASLAIIAANLPSLSVFVQECEDATDFAAVSDAQNLADDTEHVTGTVSVEWDKTGGSNVISGVDDTITAVDLSAFSPGDYITACFYIPALTDVAKVHLQIGTDNANYTEWEWADSVLTTGWNFVTARLTDYSSIAGTGMQQGVVTYVQAAVEFDLAADTMNDMKVDHIAFVTAEVINDPSTAAMVALLTTINTAVEALADGVVLAVDPQTGAGAIAYTTSFAAAFELTSITLHLDIAGTTTEDFEVVLDANDDPGAQEYDTKLLVLDLEEDSITDLVLTPQDYPGLPKYYEAGDELKFVWPNTEGRTWGLRIAVKGV